MKFEERLIQLRKSRGMSQETLAGLVGVSRQAVSKWETGEAQPDYAKLIALADALGVSLDHLCARDGEAAPAESAPKPERKRWGRTVLLVCGLAVLFVLGLLAGLGLGRSGADELEEPAARLLPDTFTVSDVKLSYRPEEGMSYQFIPSVTGEGYIYQVVFVGPDGREQRYDAQFSGGVCSGTVRLGGSSGSGWTAVAVLSNGLESRQVAIAKDIHYSETGSGWSAPN